MSMSLTLTPAYAAKSASSIGNLYTAFTASRSSAVSQPANAASGPDAVVTLSDKALELMRVRQVSDQDTRQFESILAKANASNAQANPKDFLNGLSASDMEVLRKVHSLADSIDISSLSDEGGANLLAQPGAAQDLNNDGLTTIGAANLFTFPPANAPDSFKKAWASATDGMSFADIPTEMIFAVGLRNIGRAPGDPGWVNPYADPSYDYKGAVDNIIGGLKYEYAHNMIPEAQFQHEMDFYNRLSQAIG